MRNEPQSRTSVATSPGGIAQYGRRRARARARILIAWPRRAAEAAQRKRSTILTDLSDLRNIFTLFEAFFCNDFIVCLIRTCFLSYEMMCMPYGELLAVVLALGHSVRLANTLTMFFAPNPVRLIRGLVLQTWPRGCWRFPSVVAGICSRLE